jgi:hypothetical protein
MVEFGRRGTTIIFITTIEIDYYKIIRVFVIIQKFICKDTVQINLTVSAR